MNRFPGRVLILSGVLVLVACGGPNQATPTAIPAAIVRPGQPAPRFGGSARTFRLITPVPVPDAPTRLAARAPVVGASRPETMPAPVAARPPTALGIANRSMALRPAKGDGPLQTLPAGTTLTVTGRRADGRTLAVFTSTGTAGWVAAEGVTLFGAGDLIVVEESVGPGPIATLLAEAMRPVVLPAEGPAPEPIGVVGNVRALGKTVVQTVPATPAPALTGLIAGAEITVLGRSAAADWLYAVAGEGVQGWIAVDQVDLPIAVEELPVILP